MHFSQLQHYSYSCRKSRGGCVLLAPDVVMVKYSNGNYQGLWPPCSRRLVLLVTTYGLLSNKLTGPDEQSVASQEIKMLKTHYSCKCT